MKFLIGTVIGFIAAVLILLWASMTASPANADEPSLPGPVDPSGIVVDPISEVKYRVKCARSYNIIDVEAGGTVRLIPSKRCGGPVGSFTATDDMSLMYATRMPGQPVTWHRLRVDVQP